MTRQEIFNKAYRGLKNQGFKQSVNSKGNCLYWNKETGLKCAIGHCIPENLYDYELESSSLGDFPLYGINLYDDRNAIEDDDIFINDLISCHDDNILPEKMENSLLSFASKYNLRIPE